MARVPEQLPPDPIPEGGPGQGPEDAGETTAVADDERVYRAVVDSPICFAMPGGVLRLSHSAFNDPDNRPSVDRVLVLQSVVEAARRRPSDGVVVLEVHAVRQIVPVAQDKKGNVLQRHAVDVVHEPKVDNKAHALIVADPAVGSAVFKKLRESLCLIASPAGWQAKPSSLQEDA